MKETVHVLFVIQGRHVASSRYRILQYIPFLEREGIKPSIEDFARKLSEWPALLKKARMNDALLLQRKQLGPVKTRALKRTSKKIVFDFDDTLWVKSSKYTDNKSLSRKIKFKRMVTLADEVIAGNTFLAEKARRHNPRVTVIPTPIQIKRYTVRPPHEDKERVTIGWIGAHGSIHYLARLIPALEKVHARDPRIHLKVICDTFPTSDTLPIEKIAWREDEEIDQLKTLDIGLMPLTEGEWSRGKCGLKALQYSAVGVPPIVTPVGINREIVKDGENGFWTRTEKAWIDRILTLSSDPRLRKAMGLNARATVEKQYSIRACYPSFGEIITM